MNYDQKNWDGIIAELIGSNYTIIHELNRAQLLDDVFNLARYNHTSLNTALNMIQYLKQEINLSPLTAGFRMLEFLQQFLDNEKLFNKLNQILMNIVDDIYANVNNLEMPKDSEDAHIIAVTKLTVNMFACRFGVKKCIQDATMELNNNLVMVFVCNYNKIIVTFYILFIEHISN